MEARNNVGRNVAGGLGALAGNWVVSVVVLILGAVALYYLYQYLFTTGDLKSSVLFSTPIRANETPTNASYPIPALYEGGEYSVSFWAYINGWETGRRKNILTIGGNSFSTLVVGLGANKNQLIVRTHTASGTPSGSSPAAETTNLSTAEVERMFKELLVDGGLLEGSNTMCDLPAVDLQRWILVTVVLNGRTVDVYLDGKLARSCVLPSFYRVDPNGSLLKVLQHGGFEGYLGDVTVYNYALNPDQVYRIYMTGPSAIQGSGILSWLRSFFGIDSAEIVYNVPTVSVTTQRVVQRI